MKICIKCGVEKDAKEFRVLHNGCRACEALAIREKRKDPAYRGALYATQREKRKDPANKEARAAAKREKRKDPEYLKFLRDDGLLRYRKRVQLLTLLKLDRPCYDCGCSHPPEVMEWDHLPGKEKSFNVSTCHAHSLEACIDEINKCQLVCANCHRIRTQSRRQKEV